MSKRKPVVLFLCSQNSCRSQMAEALLKKYAGDVFDIHSAGLHPADEVHPLARQVMDEIDLPLTGQEPKNLKQYLGKLPVRYAIIVCSIAARECPTIWPGMSQRFTWPFDDPAQVEGTEEQKLAEFRRVRDEIGSRLQEWVKEMPEVTSSS